MDMSLFLLVILLATPSPSLSEPSGKLGCRFSPVCDKDEVCAEDKLFGTCTQRSANYLPSYALDPAGLKRLKATVQYLLDQGFAWEDQYAQDSLQDLLYPYKHNIIPLSSDPRPLGHPQKPSVTDEEMEVWSNVDELAQAYQAVVDEYKQRYDVYNELISQYGLGGDEFDEYGIEMREKYLGLIQTLKAEERKSLQKLYDLYYDKYLSLLKMYSGPDEGIKLGVDDLEDAGEGNDGEDWEGMYKMQQLKEYLQLLFNENQDRLASSDEGSEGLMESSYSYQEDWNDEIVNEILTNDGVPEGEEVADEIQDEGTEEKEDIVDVILDSLDGNYWNTLPADEKDKVMDEFFKVYFSDADISEEEQEEGEVKEKKGGEAAEEEEAEAKGKGVGEPGQEFVEPLKQPKESGVNLGVDLSKKDDVAAATPEPSGKDKTPAAPTTLKPTTFAPSGYVFIALQSGVSVGEARMLVEELANALDAPQGSFTDIEAGEKQVTFKVHPDVIRMTPAEVAGAAATHQTDLEDMMGVTITETGVGKQTHITVLDAPADDNSTLVILTVVLVACIVGILIAVITVYCYRQKSRIRAKLKGLAANEGAVEGEATADYQDLCRQRMASKSSEKPEPLSRISSVAMSDGAAPSPSSRSSTSSWSEEPVQSNMDISTGHIVLSYMEDHLRNKDRLTKEWEALCRYEPDASSTKMGALPVNLPKNRYQGVLPYDHTRVLLNDSTNAQNSDYINASSIADADPRNPAYIAAQAPLPSTVADFWQMVWEQGVVVIVNLTPMTDSDTVHNLYWPTEGGTRYHFYEVHLVSEHVWCDDYLVRSFYLKNTETQETRTVTQFHFLTWPENGIPPSPKALLEFRRKVNKSYRGKACPIVVHCSDGVGRSGTYILVDMVLTRMTKGAKEIDIAATLEHIRDQRPGAVKMKEQFEFALTALAEEVNAILKALPQ